MAPLITTATQIRAILTDGMRDGGWWEVSELYDLVEREATLTAADWEPEDTGSSVPRWKRNVRNVLQSGKRGPSPFLDWDRFGHRYRLHVAPSPDVTTNRLATGAAPIAIVAPDRGDVGATFMPADVEPLAAAVVTELGGIAWDAIEALAEGIAEACQAALEDGTYSDAPTNPRGKDRVRREMAGSPAIDELGTALTEYILTRYGGIPAQQLSPAKRAAAKGFAHKRLGFFLNMAESMAARHQPAARASPDRARGGRREDAEDLLRPRKRGPSLTAAQRRAVEQRAVDVATKKLVDEGWDVKDVGATHSYDLHATRPGELHLYVEVKGTTGPLGSVQLTANEVALARSHYPSTALFVVHDIVLEGDAQTPEARAGTSHPIRPWRPDEARLRPTAFSYRLLVADGALGSLY